jgi:hypothetical protein
MGRVFHSSDGISRRPFIRWNIKNLREYRKVSRGNFFKYCNRPVNLKILLYYWSGQGSTGENATGDIYLKNALIMPSLMIIMIGINLL